MGELADRWDAVTFDYWNTLIPETGEVREVRRVLWASIFDDVGRSVAPDRLDEAFAQAWKAFDARWRANQPSDISQVTADALDALEVEVDPPVRARLEAAYLEASDLTPRQLLPGVEELLDRLRGSGVRIGVICDVGTVPSSRLRRWLDELGVAHLIDHYSFSDEVGVYKPHPAIFDHALRGLGVDRPDRAVHVGDLRRTDVAGARGAGMVSVRYRGGREDDEAGDEADHVTDHHAELLDVLRSYPTAG